MKKNRSGECSSISGGLVVATSCLVSLETVPVHWSNVYTFAMAIAMLLNMTIHVVRTQCTYAKHDRLSLHSTHLRHFGPFPTLISMVGGYIICNTMSCGEASIFSFSLADAGRSYSGVLYTHSL